MRLSNVRVTMLGCWLLAFAAHGWAQHEGVDEPCRQCRQIDGMVSSEFIRAPMGSVTVGVVEGNRLVWTKSYGNAESVASRAANPDTVYRIGSITKIFTATMLEQLVEAGKVQITDPVEKYFPEVNTVKKRYKDAPPITLLQLATHTAGFSREPDHTATYVTGQPEAWKQTLIAALPHVQYESKPGPIPISAMPRWGRRWSRRQGSLTWTIFRNVSSCHWA